MELLPALESCSAPLATLRAPPRPAGLWAARRQRSASLREAATADQPTATESWPGGRLAWHRRPTQRVEAAPSTPPIVILPGFGNCTEDYVLGLGEPANSLVNCLQERGFHSQVVQVKRSDWLQALRGLLTRQYWQQKCQPAASYGWYLARVQQAVNLAREQTGHSQVILVGHSAGGWLGRAFMADPMYFESPPARPDDPHQAVSQLVSLGTPHSAPAAARDMTGGALTWVNQTFPGAHFMDHGIMYTCVAGRTVRGDCKAGRRSIERYSYGSYAQVCGEGQGAEGDGVVPYQSALLQGANNLLLGWLDSTSEAVFGAS
ncbi:hypothetical protein WJX73_009128 [Symbiochloris irregularis]|uniref:AB hydrolase-1 domain-containing protein n=1 Tax=Symbiochloris irregularis TaxID=706552 RepID=A0AAW1NNK5_9CHLO